VLTAAKYNDFKIKKYITMQFAFSVLIVGWGIGKERLPVYKKNPSPAILKVYIERNLGPSPAMVSMEK